MSSEKYNLNKMVQSLSESQILSNYAAYSKLLIATALPNQKAGVESLLSHLENRLALCPGSSKIAYHNAFPGGLVDHSLRVAKLAKQFVTGMQMTGIPIARLIFACLLHDLGKIGDERDEYYIPQTNDWLRGKGEPYQINPAIRYMATQQRSVYLCQHYGIQLSHEQYLAILLNDGQYSKDNAAYAMKEPELAIVLHTVDLLATKIEKGEFVKSQDSEFDSTELDIICK
jgi:hypothetical protein